MFRKVIFCALASAATIPTVAAAQGHGGGGGGGMGHGGGVGAGIGNGGFGSGPMGGMGNAGGLGSMNNSFGIQTRDASRIDSQGLTNASPHGIAHANQNSSLSGSGATTTSLNTMFPGTRTTSTVTSGMLVGLTTGMTLMSNGTAVGTVQQIRTTGNGSVAVVIVRGTNGSFFAIPANKLTLSGGILSTTARLNGINGSSQARVNSQGLLHASPTGIAHANLHSVLAGKMVVSGSLAGLTTGQTVHTSTGTTLGTVSQIVTGSDGSVRLVIVTSSTGQVFRLSPTSLTLAGGVVTTTQTFG